MATKNATLTKDALVSMYMNYVLEHNEKPKSVYQFSKYNSISETEFYNFFGTIEILEKEIFKIFFENTLHLIQKEGDYESYDMKGKLLSFNFTFFELLTANRSYVTLALKDHGNQLKSLMQLSSLRTHYIQFVSEIISEGILLKQERLQNIQEKAIQESFWVQLVLTMKFWLDDSSPALEKTDLYIEKSINTAFELMNAFPLDSLFDFGKFLFKEKVYTK
ncbi:TetR family transcriptional regulator C-terminal domain-containing protein [Flavobacterium sp.]|uniref:TetR family transcriptional regulator C-terminal domain-containing protein n=1 Tax=Flavobacterium sp. TaxID=239 RepID=UPI003342A77A